MPAIMFNFPEDRACDRSHGPTGAGAAADGPGGPPVSGTDETRAAAAAVACARA